MSNFKMILEPKEVVLWEGRPEAIPFLLDKSIPYFFSAGIWVTLVYIFLLGETNSLLTGSQTLFLLLPHFFIAMLLIVVPIIYSVLAGNHTSYVATDRRILIQSGIFGKDFESIEYDEIAQTKVDVGLRDLLSGGSGSVFLHGKYRHAHHGSGGQFLYCLSHVKNPYEVFKMVEKVSRDFKTEMKYPNKYRPKKNKGYKTKYKEGAAIEV